MKSKIHFDFSPERIKMAIVAVVVILILAFLINFIPKGKEKVSMNIIDRVYKPSYYTYSTRIDNKGRSSMTSTYHPETWKVVLKYNDGEVCDMECSQKYYYQAKAGKSVQVYEYYGCIFNNIVYRNPVESDY